MLLKNNLKEILNEIKLGNNLKEEITLVGATKFVPIDDINNAIKLGLKVVAENRVQEFNEKHQFIEGARQDFIGHLQTNKVKYLVGNVSLIHSVDSLHLAETINELANKKNIVQDILIEINIGGELSKSGFSPENAIENIETISKLKNIKINGLMAMLPKEGSIEFKESLCDNVRSIYDKLNSMGFHLTTLSMGMSEDYKIAIKHGSNTIRIGSLLFGKRDYSKQSDKKEEIK